MNKGGYDKKDKTFIVNKYTDKFVKNFNSKATHDKIMSDEGLKKVMQELAKT